MSLADEGFSAYAVRGEGSSSEVEELGMHLVLTYDDEASIDAAQSVTYVEGCGAAIVIFLGWGGADWKQGVT